MAIAHSSVAWSGQGLSRTAGGLAALDPRLRLLLAVGFAFTAVLTESVWLKLGLVGAGLALCLYAGIPRTHLLRRLLAFEGFMLLMVLSLPFTVPGPVWFEVVGLTASWTGLQQGLAIVFTATAVVTGLLALVGSQPAFVLGQSLAAVGVPERLVALLLLTVRYLDVVGGEFRRMRNSMRARAFVAGTNRHTWRSTGHLVGMGLVRSIERAERITAAMRCRGFDGRYPVLYPFQWRPLDTGVLIAAAVFFVGVVLWSIR